MNKKIGSETHIQDGKLTKSVFRQIVDEPKEKELLLSLFPAMEKYKPKAIEFIQVNCKFVLKKKGDEK